MLTYVNIIRYITGVDPNKGVGMKKAAGKKVLVMSIIVAMVSGCASYNLSCEESCALEGYVCDGIATGSSRMAGVVNNYQYDTSYVSGTTQTRTNLCRQPKEFGDQADIQRYSESAREKLSQNTKSDWMNAILAIGAALGIASALSE